jgi:hypothetical protein
LARFSSSVPIRADWAPFAPIGGLHPGLRQHFNSACCESAGDFFLRPPASLLLLLVTHLLLARDSAAGLHLLSSDFFW